MPKRISDNKNNHNMYNQVRKQFRILFNKFKNNAIWNESISSV